MNNESVRLEEIFKSGMPRFYLNIFIVAFGSSMLLMASGLFLGTISIDDELHVTSRYFEGIGRGSWGLELISYLLPGQLGISFAPILFGCGIYALSTTILISLWNLRDQTIANFCAAIIGCFPYFASMMTFDVVQIAYPIGFVLIVSSLLPVFRESTTYLNLIFGALGFSLAFACYQGVSTSFVSAFASAAGMRFLLHPDKTDGFRNFWLKHAPRGLAVALLGGVLYLASDKLAQRLFPHHAWGDAYKVKFVFDFWEKSRFDAIVNNISALLLGKTGDLPQFSAWIFLLAILPIGTGIFAIRNFALWKKGIVFLILCASIFILPFWLVFVQSNLLAPRSMVGLGILYGFVFAALATITSKSMCFFPRAIAVLWCFQFLLLGNEMYYSQHLVNNAEQAAVQRIAARLDTLAAKNSLPYPLPVTIVGRYMPAGQTFAKFSTLGHSPLDWDAGNIGRQAAVFRNLGIDGVQFEGDSKLRKEIERYVQTNDIPKWPHPGSVFVYSNKIAAVNFGNLPRLEKRNYQSEKPKIDATQTQALFDSLTQNTLGNSFKIKNTSLGIHLVPGGQATEAVFDIAGNFRNVRLAGFITELPPSGLEDPKAGTIGVEIFVDGQSQGRRPADRFTNQIFSLDLTNATELKVVVDCANGTANWDHFYLGVVK
jgi:hypothetical protein